MTENSDFWFDYDRTPRDVTDMNGRRLEIGEEPVKVTVFAPGFGRKYPWGHVQMEYEGLVIDFEAGGMRNLKADQPQIFEEGVRHITFFRLRPASAANGCGRRFFAAGGRREITACCRTTAPTR